MANAGFDVSGRLIEAVHQRLTFRSSRITYYGPHRCPNCSAEICKMGVEFGGNAFDYPDGPIYPNTEWHPHVCDPRRVAQQIKSEGYPPVSTHPDGTFTEIVVNRCCAGCRQPIGSQHLPHCHRQGVVSPMSGYLDNLPLSPGQGGNI